MYMHQTVKAKVSSVKNIAKDTITMYIQHEYLANKTAPGQFLHILIQGHTLRRPISIADVNKEDETVTIIFKVIGEGTKRLAQYKQDDLLNVLGPNGKGFPTEDLTDETMLLIGGGVGIPPLHYLGKHLAKNSEANIVTILGFHTKAHVFYEREFQSCRKTIIMTNDGTYGEKGYVTDILPSIEGVSRYYTCGPKPMMQAVTEQMSHIEGYISIEEYMGCGIGACFACMIQTKDEKGYRKICQDGPVFQANEVKL